MSTITDQIEKQYTNFDNDELKQQFSGTSVNQPEGATFSQSREVALENLKNQYKYYLRRYEAAYGQLMVNKSPVLLNNQNSDKVRELEQIVSDLNEKLKKIVQAISNNNNLNDSTIQEILQKNAEMQYQIAKDADRLESQTSAVNDRYQNLASEAQMMVYGSQMSRNKTNNILLYSILSALALLIFIGLFIKLSKKAAAAQAPSPFYKFK